MTKISHPDPATTHVRITVDDTRSERGLSAALDELLAFAQKLPRVLGENEDEEVPQFLVITFHARGKWLSERRFFERCVRFAALRPRVARYVERVNPKRWKKDPFAGTGFWTSILTPAGALAAVPLAIADVTYVDTLIEHLRGSDLDHETFHRSLVAEIVRTHGVCDATLRFVAFRAVDGQGQNGVADLQWLVEHGGLAPHVEGDAFAALVDRISERASYRALYVANAGKGLFARNPDGFARWLRGFEARGLSFDTSDRELPTEVSVSRPRSWRKVWKEAASCTDRDD